MYRLDVFKHFAKKNPMELRVLQADALHHALFSFRQGESCWTINAPCGFGKTVVMMAIAGHLLRKGIEVNTRKKRKFKGAIVVVPTHVLIPAFLDIDKVKIGTGWGPNKERGYTLNVGKMIRLTTASRDQIATFFQEGGIIVMTDKMFHQHQDLIPKDLSNWILCIDEAHHAPLEETGIITICTKLRSMFQKQGGYVIQATATTWHTESGQRIYNRGDAVAPYGLRQLRALGLVPQNFELHKVMLNYDAKTLQEFMCETGASLAKAYTAIRKYWEDTDRPYTGIRLQNRDQVKALKKAFHGSGARILDLTGNKLSDAVAADLEHERYVTDYRKRKYDIVVACRRLDEGLDITMMSNVYYLGAPGSIRLGIQFAGRTLRVKSLSHYPKRWKDTSAMTMFVPRANKATKQAFLVLHAKNSMLMAAYLDDTLIGDTMITHLEGCQSMRNPPEYHGNTEHKARRKRAEVYFIGDDMTRAEAKVELHKLIIAHSTGDDLAADARKVGIEILKMPFHKRTSCITAFTNHFSKTSPEEVKEVVDRFEQILDEAEHNEQDLHKAELSLFEAFRRMLIRFKHLTKIVAGRQFMHVMSEFHGIEQEEFVDYIRKVAMSMPLPHEAIRATLSFKHRTKRWPTKQSGSGILDGLPSYTWGQIINFWPEFGLEWKSFQEFCLAHDSQQRRRRRKK